MTIGVVVGTIAIVAVVIVIGVLIDRRFRLLPAKEDFETDRDRKRKEVASHAAGEAAATALRVRAAQVDKLRTSQRCASCRAVMRNDADDAVRYDKADLLVLHFTCPSCAQTRTLYVEPAP